MKVKKRNGRLVDGNWHKITQHVSTMVNLEPKLNELIDPTVVSQKTIVGLYDGVSTVEINDLLAETAASMVIKHPDYTTLASRILITNLHKNTPKNFEECLLILLNNVDIRTNQSAPLITEELYNLYKQNEIKIKDVLDHKRDYNLNYFGIKTLMKSYLLKSNNQTIETPQYLYMRVALAIWRTNIDMVIKVYNELSTGLYTHATPTLFNAGTPRPQLSSCFLLANKEDSLEGIMDTAKDVSKISSFAGGIGLHIHDVRATGSYIKGSGGTSNGWMPLLKVHNELARYWDQGGGKRKGSFAIYGEPWHYDIEMLLNIRKNHGIEAERARELFPALWIPDLFMERVESNANWTLMCPNECPGLSDVYGDDFKLLYERYETSGKGRKTIKAQDLWYKILESQIETGTPYMLYKDSANRKSNQQNLGTIKSSNLCSEIIEYSSPEEQAVCNLASLALPKFIKTEIWRDVIPNSIPREIKVIDFESLEKAAYQVTLNLDEIIDINYYPTSETELSNKRHRPIGIGIQGLADIFAIMNIAFDSKEAKQLNDDIFETIYYGALLASNQNASVKGPYDTFDTSPSSKGILQFDLWNKTEEVHSKNRYNWTAIKEDIKSFGLRNSLLLAPMPTASTAQILGNNECFTEGTEVLTSKGWVDFKDITKISEIAQVDLNKNLQVSFVNPINIINKKIDGNIIRISSKSNRFKYFSEVTENHDIVIKNCNKRNNYKIKAKDLELKSSFEIPTSGYKTDGLNNLSNLEKFKIAFQADGYNKARSLNPKFQTIVFGFSKEWKIERLTNLVKELKFEYSLYKDLKSNINHKDAIKITVKVPLDIELDKTFDWINLKTINRNWVREFIHEISLWDGWAVEDCIRYSNTNKKAIDKIQSLCAVSGYFCHIGVQEHTTTSTVYQLTITERNYRGTRNLIKETEKYNGLVYCVTVPTGAIIVRKNGCVTVSGNCFEPFTSNLYTRRVLSGEFIIVNKYLVNRLIELELWNDDIINKLKLENGSVQNIPEIPVEIKEVFKTVWEISQKTIIDMSADRGKYICQSQSLNIFMENANFGKLTSMHFYGWKAGLKTGMYYLRTKSAVDAIKFTATKAEEEITCSLDNPEGCEMCSG